MSTKWQLLSNSLKVCIAATQSRSLKCTLPFTGYRLRYSNGTSIVDTTGEGSRQHVLTGLTCKWQQSMLEGLDHTVQLSLWRHCRIVSNEQIIIVACTHNLWCNLSVMSRHGNISSWCLLCLIIFLRAIHLLQGFVHADQSSHD